MPEVSKHEFALEAMETKNPSATASVLYDEIAERPPTKITCSSADCLPPLELVGMDKSGMTSTTGIELRTSGARSEPTIKQEESEPNAATPISKPTAAFDDIDVDHDGFLSKLELTSVAAASLNVPDREKFLRAVRNLAKFHSEVEEISNDEWGDENNGISKRDLELYFSNLSCPPLTYPRFVGLSAPVGREGGPAVDELTTELMHIMWSTPNNAVRPVNTQELFKLLND